MVDPDWGNINYQTYSWVGSNQRPSDQRYTYYIWTAAPALYENKEVAI